MDEWKYIYLEQGEGSNATSVSDEGDLYPWGSDDSVSQLGEEDPNAGLTKKRGSEWEAHLQLPQPIPYTRSEALSGPCDPEDPRIFHMFWTGPFTDKPYLALMSYLFTQNLGLHLPLDHQQNTVCRPQFWLWINPGPAAAVPNPSARKEMFEQLKSSPWASPFLHPRFKGVIQFKMWNTTEQLDGVPELKEEWRALQETLFNSGGHVIQVPQKKESSSSNVARGDGSEGGQTQTATDSDDMLNRLGSKSSSSYDRLSVISR